MLDEKEIFKAADYLVDKWGNNEGYPRVAFEFEVEEKREVELLIDQIEPNLPKDVYIYNVDGRKVFEIKENQFAQPSKIVFFLSVVRNFEEVRKKIREKYALG